MKKNLLLLSVLGAAFSLIGCSQDGIEDIAPVIPVGEEVEIFANTPDTRTTNNGLGTEWSADDQLTVFCAEAGSTEYGDNHLFAMDSTGAGLFKGNIENYDFEAAHDWYAIYPYTSYIKTPANTDSGYVMIGCKDNGQQTQSAADNMAHISGAATPLYGIVKNVTGKPTFQMKNIASVICFNITNSGDEDLTISSIKFTNESINLVGSWFINFAQEPLVFTDKYKSMSVTLGITTPATLAKGDAAKFYVAVKPGTIPAGDDVELEINGGLIKKTTTLAADLTFNAGKIKTLNYSVAKPVLATETWHKVTSLADITDGEYIITHDGYYVPSTTAAQKQVLATSFPLTFTDGVYTGTDVTAAMRWNFTLESGNYTITNAGGDYLYCVKDNNGLGVGNTEDTWTITQIASAETFNFKDSAQGRYLTLYSTSNWRCYTSTTSQGDNSELVLYKKGEAGDPIVLTPLATPTIMADASENVVTVIWGDVENAANYTVTCGTQTQTIDQGEEEATFTMDYGTTYTVSVVANPADPTTYSKSAAAETSVTTEPYVATEETWVKITALEDITDGEYIVSYNGYYVTNTATSSDPAVEELPVSIASADEYTGTEVTPEMRWNIAASGTTLTLTNAAGDYLCGTSGSTTVKIGTASDTWTVEAGEGYFTLKSAGASRYAGVYTNSAGKKIRAYNNLTQTGVDFQITFYKKGTLDTRTQLATPEVIADAAGNVVTVGWTDVANAGNYTVTCGDQTQTIDQGEEEATFTMDYNTEYTVTIVANPADETSYRQSAKATTTVTTGANASAPALDTPVLTVTETTVSWETVENAVGYSWYVLGISGDATDLTFSGTTTGATAADRKVNVQSLTTTPGDYWVTVKALGDGVNYKDSAESEAAEVTIESGAAAQVTYTLDFTGGLSKVSSTKVNGYTDSWTATCEGKTWNLYGFNNSNLSSAWTYVKAGRKNYNSTADVETAWKVDEAIEHIEVQYASVQDKSKINSITITIASDADFTTDVETYTPEVADFAKDKATGHFTITNPKPNRYYRIRYNMASHTANGIIWVEKVKIMNFIPAGE